MNERITTEQRELIHRLLDERTDRHEIARLASVTPGQVSALAAHRTMKRLRTAGPIGHDFSESERSEHASPKTKESLLPTVDMTASKIPLGIDVEAQQIVSWCPQVSNNPHVLIVGESGSGKTYTASRLVLELAREQLTSVIFDYGQGFSLADLPSTATDGVHALELNLSRDGIQINPLEVFPIDMHGPATVAQRVADTFVHVYPRLGVQQHALLRKAVLELLADSGISAEDSRTWKLPPPPFRDLEAKINEYCACADAGIRRAASSAATHVSTLFFFNTFRKTGRALSWNDLLQQKRQIWILQLGGLEASVERAVTEFLLWSLVRYFEMLGPGPLRCFVVLDEAHKLAFGPDSPVEKILREGRKFGLGVILASQQPEDFSPVAFTNSATKIVFQIADPSGQVSRQLHRKVRNKHSRDYIASVLGTLPRGSAYVVINNIGCVTKMLSFSHPVTS
jgi:DNA phosphorothioation-dependent restriction protein DptH